MDAGRIGKRGYTLAEAAPAEVERLCASLQAFNQPFLGDAAETHIRLVVRDRDGSLLGGILAEVALGWLEIQVLWVEPGERSSGVGAALLTACERRACALGAHGARLDTFDWQAEGFYARHGYVCFGRLQDYPRGHARVFMSKRL